MLTLNVICPCCRTAVTFVPGQFRKYATCTRCHKLFTPKVDDTGADISGTGIHLPAEKTHVPEVPQSPTDTPPPKSGETASDGPSVFDTVWAAALRFKVFIVSHGEFAAKVA